MIGKDPKAEMLVEEPVPGNVAERDQRECSHALAGGPAGRPLDRRRPTQPPALMVRGHADLFDMGRVVNHIDQDVANGRTTSVLHRPRSPPRPFKLSNPDPE